MNDYTLFDKYKIPRPPSFAGMNGQGPDAMYSVGGRWMKAGQTTSDGYLINSYDPKSYTLGMSYQGVPVPVQMRAGTIQPYTPEFVKQSGGMTEAEIEREQQMSSLINNANSYLNDPTLELPKPYAFSNEILNKMRQNYFGNKERKVVKDLVDVVSLEQFKNMASSPDAKKGLYYVPYQSDDGNVDFHDFYMAGQETETEQDNEMMTVKRNNPDGQTEIIKIPFVGKRE